MENNLELKPKEIVQELARYIIGQNEAKKAVAKGARAIVLDDGFSHRRINRDLDLLLISPDDVDPSTPLLPLGPLREPVSSLSRADLTAGFAEEWEGIKEAPPILFEYKPVDPPKRDAVVLFSGIAKPERFLKTVKKAGYKIVEEHFFPDHHKYTLQQIEKLCRIASGFEAQLLTTAKDLARLSSMEIPYPIQALKIEVKIARGEQLLNNKLVEIFNR